MPEANQFRKHNSINILTETDHIYSFLAKVDILLLPSKNESYPIIILEALNAGCKIIASNVGGISENKSKEIKLISQQNSSYWIRNIIKTKILSLEKRRSIINLAGDQHNLDYYIKRLEKNL